MRHEGVVLHGTCAATPPAQTPPGPRVMTASSYAPPSAVNHVFTVDVEEYFQVNAFDGVIARSDWDAQRSRVAFGVDHLLDLLARHGVTGTFFVLGWIADRQPAVVRRIADAGHEVASHGWSHRRVTTLTRQGLHAELRDSKRLLEDVSGQQVLGFRAPSFSITPGFEWAFDLLLEEGYRYDSSLFAVRRPGYGYPGVSEYPHAIERPAGSIFELPLATVTWCGLRLPAAGGGYFRHFPYAFTRRAFRELTRRGIPGTFYIHPWELDPDQPRLRVPAATRMRHYGGLRHTSLRLSRLLSQFRFTSASRLLESMVSGPGEEPVARLPGTVPA